MRPWQKWCSVAALGVGALAFAEGSGKKLYVQAPSARLQSVAGAKGNTVETLPRGTEVQWLGPDASAKGWHKVQHASKSGVMFQAVLSPKPPVGELVVKGDGSTQTATAQQLADSGAATKALSDGAVTYGKATQHEDAVRQLLTAEAVAAQTTDAKVAEHAKKGQLSPLAVEVKR